MKIDSDKEPITKIIRTQNDHTIIEYLENGMIIAQVEIKNNRVIKTINYVELEGKQEVVTANLVTMKVEDEVFELNCLEEYLEDN